MTASTTASGKRCLISSSKGLDQGSGLTGALAAGGFAAGCDGAAALGGVWGEAVGSLPSPAGDLAGASPRSAASGGPLDSSVIRDCFLSQKASGSCCRTLFSNTLNQIMSTKLVCAGAGNA